MRTNTESLKIITMKKSGKKKKKKINPYTL